MSQQALPGRAQGIFGKKKSHGFSLGLLAAIVPDLLPRNSFYGIFYHNRSTDMGLCCGPDLLSVLPAPQPLDSYAPRVLISTCVVGGACYTSDDCAPRA